MIFIEKEAKTVEEAIALGLEQLGMDEDDVEIEVLKRAICSPKPKCA